MEMMNHLKRILAWVMTAAMLVSACPTTAIAEEIASQAVRINVQSGEQTQADTLTEDEAYAQISKAFAQSVSDAMANGSTSLITGALSAPQEAIKTGRPIALALSLKFGQASGFAHYDTFVETEDGGQFSGNSENIAFDAYENVAVTIHAPAGMQLSLDGETGWTDHLTFTQLIDDKDGQSVTLSGGVDASSDNVNLKTGSFYARLTDNGEHAAQEIDLSGMVEVTAQLRPKMVIYKDGALTERKDGAAVDYAMPETVLVSQKAANDAAAKTWAVQIPDEETEAQDDDHDVTFTYHVKTGAVSDGVLQQDDASYTEFGVLDLSEYRLNLTLEPIENNGAPVYPKQIVMTLRRNGQNVNVPCAVAPNADGTYAITPDSSVYNDAALTNSIDHPNVHVFSDYTLSVIYDKRDFELDCDDERIAEGGLNVKLNAALTYKSYGDAAESRDTANAERQQYYVKRDGGFITPEQYVKLAADEEAKTEYRDSGVTYELYKEKDTEVDADGHRVIKAGATAAATVSAFEQSKELPAGTYYVVRKGMPEDYTNITPDSYVYIDGAAYVAQTVVVAAKQNTDAEFEDYNAQNGALVITKNFYALNGAKDESEALSASFTLTKDGEGGQTFTVNAHNGKPTTVYLPAGTYTLEEIAQEGYLTMAPAKIEIRAQESTTYTVDNYPSEGELHLAAYLRRYSQDDQQDVQNLSDYNVIITDADGNAVDAAVENGVVRLPRKDAEGNDIIYRVTVENGEATNGLFSHTKGDGQAMGEDKQTVEISFAENDKLVQSVDYIFIRRQKLTIEKRLVDVTGKDAPRTWHIEVAKGAGLAGETVELATNGGEQTVSAALDLRGWDEEGNVIAYTVTEREANQSGYTTAYSTQKVTLTDDDQTVIVTNTRQVGKAVFTKRGSDEKLLAGAEYAVIAKKADGSRYLVSTTSEDGVLTLDDTAVSVTADGQLESPETVSAACRFTTDENGSLALNLSAEDGTTYYMQELTAPAGYYLNDALIDLTVSAGEQTTAGQADQKQYELTVTKQFPDGAKAGSFAAFTLYSDEACTEAVETVTVQYPDVTGTFAIPAYGTYYVRETAVSGDMKLNGAKIGPLTYTKDSAAQNPEAVENEANVGKLNIELIDQKKKKLGNTNPSIDYADDSDKATFTVSVYAADVPAGSYAYTALTELGFTPDETGGKLVYTAEKRDNQTLELAGLPIYGDPNDADTALTYTVEQTEAPRDYFLSGETEQNFALNENANQTLTFENEPKAEITVRLNYQKEFELKKGNAPFYPLTGAEMTLYEVGEDGKLTRVDGPRTMTDTALTISGLHGLKRYVLVETKTPEGYCAYSEADGHDKNERYGETEPATLDDLENFKYVELTGQEAANQNEQINSIITNYKDYAQLQLNKLGYTVLFGSGDAASGKVTRADEPLDYCQFKVYAIRTKALTEDELTALMHSGFTAPGVGETVERGTYTGKAAALSDERILALIASKDAFTDDITYETGASGKDSGAFMTDAFELDGDIADYTFVFREVKINHTRSYQPIFGGFWAVSGAIVNDVKEITAYNEADVVAGEEPEFRGVFRVELDKQYWPTRADMEGNNADSLADLAGVTFELILAQKDEHGLLQPVEGEGAFKTEFVTGVENGFEPSYGVSITVSLKELYEKNLSAGAANPVTLSADGETYEADFILREAAYPINMVYVREQYDLHVTVNKPENMNTVAVANAYSKAGTEGSIKNLLGEMTYLTLSKYVDGARYYGGENSTDAVYSIYNTDGTLYTTVTLNGENDYETTVQLPRNTTFILKETTAPVIDGVQTDRGGFVRVDGDSNVETTANSLTFTTGEYMSKIVVRSMNTTFRSLTVIKKDAGEQLEQGAPIQISYSTEKSGTNRNVILNGNDGETVASRQETDENGEAAFSLPMLDYRTNRDDQYDPASYVISEAHDYNDPSSAEKDKLRVVDSYFGFLNGSKLNVGNEALAGNPVITVYNPATTSLTIHKVSDRTDGENGEQKPLEGVSFRLLLRPFASANDFSKPNAAVAATGYYYDYGTKTTDENGDVTFDGLYSGLYKLVETIPMDQVDGGKNEIFIAYIRVVCDADAAHIAGQTYTGEAGSATAVVLKTEGKTAYNAAEVTDANVVTVTNTARAYLEISKTFEPSQAQTLGAGTEVSFTVYKQDGTLATLYDVNAAGQWSETSNPFTLSFSENERSASRIVRLDPGTYTVEESMSTSAGYWFAQSAAYENGAAHRLSYNGTKVENDRIISSRDVTVTKYNVMDDGIERQMKVDFLNSNTLMGGSVYKTSHIRQEEDPSPLAGCTFALYVLDENHVKRYYAGRAEGTPFGDWTASRTSAVKFASDENGVATLTNVYAPQDAAVDGAGYAYYVEEIHAPNPSYQLAYDETIELAAGGTAAVSMVNTRGVSVQVRVFGSVRENRGEDTPVVKNAVLHIMKRLADGTLAEIDVTGENGASQPYLYREVVSDENGDVLFPYLPRLEAGESYVVFEEADADGSPIGDAADRPYLNPVSQNYKDYYEFEATDDSHKQAQNALDALEAHPGYYTVVTYEDVIQNPNELFSTLHFNAYNEPKGKLVILKRDYENAETLVSGAQFSAEERGKDDGKKSYAFAALTPSGDACADAPETLAIGQTTYTLSADKTYYETDGYRYTYVITTYVEEGTYDFAETTTPNGYIATPKAAEDMPWYAKAEATLTNEGGYAAVAFANIPEREPYLSKSVVAVNGEQSADATLNNLQNNDWQTVTFAIADATRDGANAEGDAIRYPMSRFVITDQQVDYRTVDGSDKQGSAWLNGEAVQALHYVDSVTVGRMSFDAACGTAAETTVFANVYGLNAEGEKLLGERLNVSASEKTVTFDAETYTGFRIEYETEAEQAIPAGLKQETPIRVTMRVKQQSSDKPIVDRVSEVRNTAKLSLTYDIGEEEAKERTCEASAAVSVDTALGLPKASVTKLVQRAKITYNDFDGTYLVTVPEENNALRDMLAVSAEDGARYTIVFKNESDEAEDVPAIDDPILLDVLPRQALVVGMAATTSSGSLNLQSEIAQDGRTITVTGEGKLEAGETITLTVDALFDSKLMLEQIVQGNTGVDDNIAYAMSAAQTVKNSRNPYGVPFTDVKGDAVTSAVWGQPGDETSSAVTGFEDQHALFSKVNHVANSANALKISKYVAGFVSGLDNFVTGSTVAVTGADVGDGQSNVIRYRILVENVTPFKASDIIVVDELPHTGDYLNDNNEKRSSAWNVAFKSLSVTRYGAAGEVTKLTAGTDYTVGYTDQTVAGGSQYKAYFDGAASWTNSMAAENVRGFAVQVGELGGSERLLIEVECAAPEVESHALYFTTANNNARLTYKDANDNKHEGVMSGRARVAIVPEKVWLGNRIWVDFNGDGHQDDGEVNYMGDLSLSLKQYYNFHKPTETTISVSDGNYMFGDLFAGVKNGDSDPNDKAGDVAPLDLSGSEHYRYELELSSIPSSYVLSPKRANNPLSSDEDSDFTVNVSGLAKTKHFYLPVITNLENDEKPGYPQVDAGLVPVRDLTVTKTADNGAKVSTATFDIYGPYTADELASLTAVSADKRIGTMTGKDNEYSFVSTESAYLTYAGSYLVVETNAEAPYLSTGAAFEDEGIAQHGEVLVNNEAHSCFVLTGFDSLPDDFRADKRKTYSVSATDLYSAAGSYTLEAQKVVTANGVALDLYKNLFQIRITSDDPNMATRFASTTNRVEVDEDGALVVTADANGRFSLTMNYATIPQADWTQRDWKGNAYTYQVEEVRSNFDGVTYDETTYTMLVKLGDDGNGNLVPNVLMTRRTGEQEAKTDSIVFNNELARRDLTITKKTQGNAVPALEDEFTVELTLSREDIVPVDGEYPIEIAEGGRKTNGTLSVEGGKATLTIRNGQTATVKDILVGTAYTVTETDDRAQGYNIDGEHQSAGEGTIATDEAAQVDLVNVRSVGSLAISKTIVGDDPVEERTFSFTAKITYPDGVDLIKDEANLPKSEGIEPEVDGQTVTFSIPLTVSQENRTNAAAITNILSGAFYTVSEDEGFIEWGYVAYTAYNDETKALGCEQHGKMNEQAQNVSFTNVRSAGQLVIGKTAEGTGVGSGLAAGTEKYAITLKLHHDTVTLDGHVGLSTKGTTYTVKSKKTANGYNATVKMELESGETVTFDKLPDGTTYSVVEDEQTYLDMGFIIRYDDEKEGTEEKNAGTISEKLPSVAAVLNTRNTHSVSVTKNVLGQMASENDSFDFAVTISNGEGSGLTDKAVYRRYAYEVYDETNALSGTGTLDFRKRSVQTISLKKGETATILDVPDGAEISVSEKMTDKQKAAGYTLASAVVETDEANNVSHVFTNERYIGSLAITKALSGTGSSVGYGKTFKFDVRLWNDRDLDLANAETSTKPSGIKLTKTSETVDGHAVYTGTVEITMGDDGQPVTKEIANILFDTNYEVTEQSELGRGYNVGRETPVYAGKIGLLDKENVGRRIETEFTNERNIGELTVVKNAVGNAVKFDKTGKAEFSFIVTLKYAEGVNLKLTSNQPTVNGEAPAAKAMTVDAASQTVSLKLTIPVTEDARSGRLTIGNILEGTTYTVREAFDPQDGYYLNVESENGTVKDGAVSGEITAESSRGDAAFTNTRNVGALDVIKKLEGTGYNDRVAESDAVRTSFGFAVRLWRDDNVALSGDNQPTVNGEKLALTARTENGATYYEGHITVDLSDGTAVTDEARRTTIGNILADTHFEVTEDENGYRTEGYVVSEKTQSGVMTSEGGELSFVNTRDTGRLAIIKNLEGSTAEYGRGFDFTVTLRRTDDVALAGTYRTLNDQKIVFTANEDGSATARVGVAGGSSVTIVGIPSGTSYSIAEADYSGDRYTVSSANANGTIVSDVTTQATFLNTRANPNTGALTITKTVEAIAGAEIPDTKFTFDITLRLENGDAFNETVRTTNQNGETDRLRFTNGTASVELGDGESITLSGLPLRSRYTVTERAAEDMRATATGNTGTIWGTAHTAAFINTMTQAYTDLTVRKAWNDANDAQKLRPQRVTVEVTRNGQTLTRLTLSDENRWTQTLTELPMVDENGEAYVYAVRETDVPEGYTASVTARGMTFTVINTHRIDDGFTPVDPDKRRRGGLTILDDLGVPLGGDINMNEGDCFN